MTPQSITINMIISKTNDLEERINNFLNALIKASQEDVASCSGCELGFWTHTDLDSNPGSATHQR